MSLGLSDSGDEEPEVVERNLGFSSNNQLSLWLVSLVPKLEYDRLRLRSYLMGF